MGIASQKKAWKRAFDKVKTIMDSGRPETKDAVRSFLGMTGYLSEFIPR